MEVREKETKELISKEDFYKEIELISEENGYKPLKPNNGLEFFRGFMGQEINDGVKEKRRIKPAKGVEIRINIKNFLVRFEILLSEATYPYQDYENSLLFIKDTLFFYAQKYGKEVKAEEVENINELSIFIANDILRLKKDINNSQDLKQCEKEIILKTLRNKQVFLQSLSLKEAEKQFVDNNYKKLIRSFFQLQMDNFTFINNTSKRVDFEYCSKVLSWYKISLISAIGCYKELFNKDSNHQKP